MCEEAEIIERALAAGALGYVTKKVFRLLGEGFSLQEMARMAVGTRTAETYSGRLLVKLGVRGMRELRRKAIAAHAV